MTNQLQHIIQAIKQIPINQNTCLKEIQAKRNLRPDCIKGVDCPYLNQSECSDYIPVSVTETRFSHLRLYR